jgi:hypothetical protein
MNIVEAFEIAQELLAQDRPKPEAPPPSGRARTQFPPGNPGRPRGARNKRTLLVEAMLEGQLEDMTARLIRKAMIGDVPALRLCLDRAAPRAKEAPVDIDLSTLDTRADIVAASKRVRAALGEGEMTPSEASRVMALLREHLAMLGLEEAEERTAGGAPEPLAAEPPVSAAGQLAAEAETGAQRAEPEAVPADERPGAEDLALAQDAEGADPARAIGGRDPAVPVGDEAAPDEAVPVGVVPDEVVPDESVGVQSAAAGDAAAPIDAAAVAEPRATGEELPAVGIEAAAEDSPLARIAAAITPGPRRRLPRYMYLD